MLTLLCLAALCHQNAGTDKSAFPLPEPQDVFLAAQVKFDDLSRDLAQLGRDLTSTYCHVSIFFFCLALSASGMASLKRSGIVSPVAVCLTPSRQAGRCNSIALIPQRFPQTKPRPSLATFSLRCHNPAPSLCLPPHPSLCFTHTIYHPSFHITGPNH